MQSDCEAAQQPVGEERVDQRELFAAACSMPLPESLWAASRAVPAGKSSSDAVVP